MDENAWSAYVKRLLKAELKRKGITYKQLAQKLAALGISETEMNVKNKIGRGGFSAAFLVQCLAAIGTHVIRLDDLPQPGE
jgi:3-mercaptopyruvate sulfurtransferase SseA